MKTYQIVKELKSNDQDFEWYPTTSIMINKINEGIKGSSILDIGCGNGQTLMKLNPRTKYGIEKSQFLLDVADPNIIVVGRDFYQQQLIDKKVDNIFCNPPYSDFKEWMIKIIKEANCNDIYFIVPKRWRNDDQIKEVIKKRNMSETSLGFYNFLDGERKARAEVEILHLSFSSYYQGKYRDPFDLFFEETFKFNIKENEKITFDEKTRLNIKNELIKGDDIIKTLVECYNLELKNLLNNYRQLENLNQEIFKELNIDLGNIKKALKLKIENLKTIYWQELFEKLDKLKERLTFKNREYISSKIINITDFNLENIYSIIIWAIKNANQYIDNQLVDLFYELTSEKNIKNYKSNQKTWENQDWRWNNIKSKISHFKLDYRIILEGWSGSLKTYTEDGELETCSYAGYNSKAYTLLTDISVSARNLNIELAYIPTRGWAYGKKTSIYYKYGEREAMEVKLFKNGNIHIKFDQEFIKKLNIEVGRIKKWIHTPKEASEEINISEFESNKYFNSSIKIKKNLKLLT